MKKTENCVTALIPVRRETNRLDNKNILPFGKTNLLLHRIEQLKKVESINKIVVSSEDDEILRMADQAGVITMKRPLEYADRGKPFGSFVEYICNQLTGEHILWACVTTPFIESELYEQAIALYFENLKDGYDSLITVKQLKRFILDENGAVNFRRGLKHKNSEDLPSLYVYVNGITLAPRASMIQWKYNWGNIPYRLEVDKKAGVEISDAYDYNLACLLEKGTNDEY